MRTKKCCNVPAKGSEEDWQLTSIKINLLCKYFMREECNEQFLGIKDTQNVF